MKLKELIELLKTVPEDTEVSFEDACNTGPDPMSDDQLRSRFPFDKLGTCVKSERVRKRDEQTEYCSVVESHFTGLRIMVDYATSKVCGPFVERPRLKTLYTIEVRHEQ